ncbi:hypothetical protein [Streptomyces sp. NPDC096030]|uniref:hypothetical protein n=1 Tax=Streptomyces sp. NPDC096030 TaxID=3155423 RepID=UPI00332A4296
MPIVVVEQEKTVAALVSRLVKARTPKAAKEQAAQAIREANPGLDLDRLRPGMIVVVPRLDEARDHDPDLVDAALYGLIEQVRRELDALVLAAQSAETDAKAELAAMREVIGDEAVQTAAQQDDTLQGYVDGLPAALDQEEQTVSEVTASLINGIEQWYTDLDDLSPTW